MGVLTGEGKSIVQGDRRLDQDGGHCCERLEGEGGGGHRVLQIVSLSG